jgi:predicted secreted protein
MTRLYELLWLILLLIFIMFCIPTNDHEPSPSMVAAAKMDKGIKRAVMMWIQIDGAKGESK